MTIKSQDDLGQRGRSVDVLTSTIDELAKVKKQLEIALKYFSLIKRNVSISSLAYTYVENAKTEIKELEK